MESVWVYGGGRRLSFIWSAWLFPGRVLPCIQLSLLIDRETALLPLALFRLGLLYLRGILIYLLLGVDASRARGIGVAVPICLSSKGKDIACPSASGSKRKRSAGSSGEVPSLVFAGRPSGLFGPLAIFAYFASFLGDDEAHESHNALGGLCHLETQRRLDGIYLNEVANFHDVSALRFIMSSTMLNRDTRSLFMEVLRLRDEVFNLKRDRSEFTAVVAKLEAKLLCAGGRLSASETALARDLKDENDKLIKEIANLRELSYLVESSKKILKSYVEALRSKCRQFKEKEAVMLAIEANLNTDYTFWPLLADLQGKALSVGRAQALKEAAAMDLGLRLEDMKDYDPDAVET
ncbi:hypothetical protein Tco_0988973 [Tanacetum coccineum]|uniref:Uncharacterized protein n=1 Tax=Tanacetum coccineum TaxID=301880 RepID=A0ABQ5ESS1_9ASTR